MIKEFWKFVLQVRLLVLCLNVNYSEVIFWPRPLIPNPLLTSKSYFQQKPKKCYFLFSIFYLFSLDITCGKNISEKTMQPWLSMRINVTRSVHLIVLSFLYLLNPHGGGCEAPVPNSHPYINHCLFVNNSYYCIIDIHNVQFCLHCTSYLLLLWLSQ